ncbi:MAG: hypothetical protein KKA45_00650 [Alphaproteobacteria bacterium]|nr:hypothetical protein [Alphaproteobacteria bacterium]
MQLETTRHPEQDAPASRLALTRAAPSDQAVDHDAAGTALDGVAEAFLQIHKHFEHIAALAETDGSNMMWALDGAAAAFLQVHEHFDLLARPSPLHGGKGRAAALSGLAEAFDRLHQHFDFIASSEEAGSAKVAPPS